MMQHTNSSSFTIKQNTFLFLFLDENSDEYDIDGEIETQWRGTGRII